VSLFDTHPLTYFFDPDADHWRLLEIDYFAYAESSQGWPESYIGDTLGVPVENQAPKYERVWPTSAVFNALTGAGLAVERFGEHPDEYWETFPKIAPERRRKIPQTYSLLARKPFTSGP
jgi:hypothetical protein